MQRVRKVEITTTFEALHKAGACKDRYQHLAKALGGIRKYGRKTPINLLQILEHNGINDFFWVLDTIEDNPIFRLMAADFAESVLSIFEQLYPEDARPREAISIARRFVVGEATIEEARAAEAAAGAAARWAARPPGTSGPSARGTAGAAGAAARGAAGAAGVAAWTAAGGAEKKKQIAIIKQYLK